MRLPTLYKHTSNSKIEQWSIWTERASIVTADDTDPDYNIVTEHGLVDGKLQLNKETVTEGKNLGKANATTAKEQAELQAKSEWNTKLTRKGYVENLERAQAGENSGAGGIRPMLAQSYSKHGDKIEFPCYAQPKLDGIRCIAVIEEEGWVDEHPCGEVNMSGRVTLWSREQKPITAVPHIQRAINELGLPPGTVLDGELYHHDLKSDFEKIVSAVRKQGPVDEEAAKLIEYHVYDLPRTTAGPESFNVRAIKLNALGSYIRPSSPLQIVHTVHCNDKERLLEYFEECRAAGYEGCMARAADQAYEEGKRSYGLQKLKEFDDAEFQIVGVYEGVGKMAGLAMFACSVKDGHHKLTREEAQKYAATKWPDGLFGCKMEGSLESLSKYLDDESTWWGKKLTVKYQGLTGKAKVPRFPVGKAIRDYE